MSTWEKFLKLAQAFKLHLRSLAVSSICGDRPDAQEEGGPGPALSDPSGIVYGSQHRRIGNHPDTPAPSKSARAGPSREPGRCLCVKAAAFPPERDHPGGFTGSVARRPWRIGTFRLINARNPALRQFRWS